MAVNRVYLREAPEGSRTRYVKMLSPVTSRQEYLRLRGTDANRRHVAEARGGGPGAGRAKRSLVQFNYSLLAADGPLAGNKTLASTFAGDIDCTDAAQRDAIAARILAMKDELGLMELSRSVGTGLHYVMRRREGETVLEALCRTAWMTDTEFDLGAKDAQRVLFTVTGDAGDLLYLDDDIFARGDIEAARAETEALAARARRGEEDIPLCAHGTAKHCNPRQMEPGWRPQRHKDTNTALQDPPPTPPCEGGEYNVGVQDSSSEVIPDGETLTAPSLTGRAGGGSREAEGSDGSSGGGSALPPPTYQGFTWDEILRTYWEVNNGGHEPTTGDRNTLTYQLAVDLRHILDNRADWLDRVIPCYDGYPADQKMHNIASAVAARSEGMPYRLSATLRALRTRKQQAAATAALAATDTAATGTAATAATGTHAASTADTADDETAPRGISAVDYAPTAFDLDACPAFFRLLLKPYSPDFHPAVLAAALPMLGTLATQVRTVYPLRHSVHSQSYMTCIMALQASGKSFVRELSQLLLKPIRDDDAEERAKEAEYFARRRQAKNSKEQPRDPRARIRLLGETISNAMLYKRLDCAEGQHCYFEAEEIDTMLKGERAGAWSKKCDLYRKAFDNAVGGQEYMSDASWNFYGPIYLNWVACGTPQAVRRFFNDPESGLVSRVFFCSLGNQMGKPLAERVEYTDAERRQIEDTCLSLHLTGVTREMHVDEVPDHDPDTGQFTGTSHTERHWAVTDRQTVLVDTAALGIDKATLDWLDMTCAEFNLNPTQYAFDTLRRRAAVIGHRAAALASLVLTDREQPAARRILARFCVMVAELVLEMQMALFGRQIDELTAKGLQDISRTRRPNGGEQRGERSLAFYNALPGRFTVDDVLRVYGKTHSRQGCASARVIVAKWKRKGLVESTERGVYHKTGTDGHGA